MRQDGESGGGQCDPARHGVWHLRDAASGEEELGECETFVNQIRRELRLPERENYAARVRLSTHIYKRPIAELSFTRTSEKQGRARWERFLLRWEAEMVGVVIAFSHTRKPDMTAAAR